MKIKFSLIALVFCLFTVGQLLAQDTDFRNHNWGADKATVKSEEKAKLILDDPRLVKYQSLLAGYNATIQYGFTIDNQLMKGQYTLRNQLANPKGYFNEFTFFENLLSEKYGEKTKTSVKVTNNSPKNEENYPLLLKAGELTKETRWSTPDTDITLSLSTLDNVTGLQIIYTSKKFNSLNKEKKKKLLLKDL